MTYLGCRDAMMQFLLECHNTGEQFFLTYHKADRVSYGFLNQSQSL